MVELKTQFPYVDAEGQKKDNLIKTFAEDENGENYYIKQVETGTEYAEAVDVYPSKYTYIATDKKIEDQELV